MAPLIGFQETFASFGTESAEPKSLRGPCKVLDWTSYPIRGKHSCDDKEVDPAYRALVDHTALVDHVNQMCSQEQKVLHEFNEKICDTDSSQDQHQVFQIPAIRDTIGYQLLIRQGWKSGCGLGKHLQGPTEAIQIEQKHEQLGLGRLQMEIERIGATTEHRRLLACERPVSQELEQENRQREQLRTDSLAQMKAAFHCDLCDLQYASYVQWDNHINSYGHAHKQRLKELQQKETHRKLSSRRCRKKERREQIGHKEPMHQNTQRVPLTTKDCNTFQHWIIRQVQQTKPTCLKQRQIRFHLLRRLKAGGGPHSAFHQSDPNCDMGHADIGKDCKRKDGLWQKVPRCPRAVYYHMKPQVSSVKPSVPFLTFVRDCGEKFIGKPCDSVEENSSGQSTGQGSKEQDSHSQSDGSSKQGDKDTSEKPSGDPEDDNSGTNKDEGKAGDGDNGGNADRGISNDSNKVNNDTGEAKPGDNGACQTVGGGDATNTDIDPGGTNAENANLEDIQLPPLPPPPNIPEGKGKMLTFVKVKSKDENRDLDWPAEMIQYTVSEPKITYSCNPLYVDLSALLLGRKPKLMDATLAEKPENEVSSEKLPVKEDINQVGTETPVPHTKSSKKKKKKKHRKGKKRKKDSKVKEEANPPNIPENVTETKTETNTMAVESGTTEKENAVSVKENEEPTEATGEVEEKKKSTKKQKVKKKKKRKSRKAKKRKHEDDNEQAGDGAKEVPAKKKKRKKKDKAKKLKKEGGTGETPVTVKSADDTGGKDTKNTSRKDRKKSAEKKQKSQKVSKKKKQEKDETQAQTKAEKTPKTPNKVGTPGKVGTPVAPVKKEGDVSQKPGESRKRNASESSTGEPGKAKKIKKTISLGKLPQRTNLANISNPLQEFETDFDTTDGKKVPKWDTSSDSEIDEGKANTPSKNPIVAATSTGFGKIGPKHKMQFPAAGGDSQHSQGSNLSAQGKLGEAASQNQVNSRTHHKSSGHSSHRSRSYSRSRSRRDWSYSSDSNHGRRSRYSDYSDSDYSRRGYSSDRYSRSRSRSYSRDRYGSSSRRSYSSYSSRSRSRSYSRGYSRSSSRSYSRGRHRRRSYSHSSYTSSSYSRSRSRGRSRSRSSSYDRRSSRSRSGSSSHSVSKKREMRESPDAKYSTVLPKRDPKPSRKSDKPSEQKTFSPDELVTPVSIRKGEVAEQAQKLLDKVKDKKSDGDPKVVAGTTLVQNENGALVGFIGKRQGAKKKEELCIPLPPGASPAGNKKGDSFIGPTLPPDHPLAPLQDIPIPKAGSAQEKQSKKPDLSKVPLPPPPRPPVFFNPSVPPPPPPPSGMTGPRMQNTQLPPLPSKTPPPPPEAEVKEPPKEEKEEEPGAMIPPTMDPEEADMYKKLQKEAARHARRKIREEEGGSTESETDEEEGIEEAQPELEEEPETIMVAEPVPIASPMTPIAHMALTPQPVPHLISGAGLAAAVGTPTPTLQPVHVPLSQPHLVPVMISQQGLVFSANPGIPVQAMQANPGLIQVQAAQPLIMASNPSGVMLAAAAQAHASQLAAATPVVPSALHHQLHPALTGGFTGLQTAALAGQAVPIHSAAAAAAAAHLPQAHSMIQPVAVQHPSGGTIVVGRQYLVPRLRHPHL